MKQENNLSQRVKQRRNQLSMTQAEVAELAGISQQSYQALESGSTKRTRHLMEIANALRCEASWLMFGDTPKTAA